LEKTFSSSIRLSSILCSLVAYCSVGCSIPSAPFRPLQVLLLRRRHSLGIVRRLSIGQIAHFARIGRQVRFVPCSAPRN
jgi:hypothetical protein